MPVWNWDEINISNRNIYKQDEKEVECRFEKWGGIPRYVLEKISAENQLELVHSIASTDLDACFGNVNQPDSPSTGNHKVFHIDAVPNTKYSQQRVVMGSNYIKRKLVQRFYFNFMEQLISRTENFSNWSAALGGVVFEQLSHQTLSIGGKFSIRQLDTGNSSVIELKDLNTVFFNKLKDLESMKEAKESFSKSDYARPEDINFPAIDSFNGHSLFQMTVSENHPITLKPFVNLLHLLDSILPGTGTPFNLFFVVPPDLYKTFKPQKFIHHDDQTQSVMSSQCNPICS
ncbi:hypothetical protein DLAC_00788 [Tieghemostelium lacteum]|uniref:Uncharacterized protein n=1 Tax=Tieghemostelium lacteum TaxID=361077 RepID=A0A152A708_TIELA|nr:hypothetical protein DLAC_00788 [Tieghemostelium lacteum]|eukprot:KYR01996.1 hypothetical protein DLAC_00788 [Tieghemostelium lacteum]